MHAQTAKLIGVIAQNLPEMSDDLMQGWIENPKGLQRIFKNALCPPETIPNFKIWKTIKLGTGLKSADDFRQALKGGDFCIGDWANDILGKPAFTAVSEEIEVDLIVSSVADLGFKNGATHRDIYKRAQEFGWELCPVEVGPQLRLQYTDQPTGEWLLIAMEPISGSGGDLIVFSVERDDSGSWLYGNDGHPAYFWAAGNRWVFVRPRK